MAVSCDPLKLWRRLLALLPPWGSPLGLPHPLPLSCYGHTGCHPSRPSPRSSRKLAPVLVTGHAGILHWSHQFSGLSLPLGSFLREYNKHILTHFLNFPCAAHTSQLKNCSVWPLNILPCMGLTYKQPQSVKSGGNSQIKPARILVLNDKQTIWLKALLHSQQLQRLYCQVTKCWPHFWVFFNEEHSYFRNQQPELRQKM